MKPLSLILYGAGICCCIAGFAGHSAAWPSGAVCFFAAACSVRNPTRK